MKNLSNLSTPLNELTDEINLEFSNLGVIKDIKSEDILNANLPKDFFSGVSIKYKSEKDDLKATIFLESEYKNSVYGFEGYEQEVLEGKKEPQGRLVIASDENANAVDNLWREITTIIAPTFFDKNSGISSGEIGSNKKMVSAPIVRDINTSNLVEILKGIEIIYNDKMEITAYINNKYNPTIKLMNQIKY